MKNAGTVLYVKNLALIDEEEEAEMPPTQREETGIMYALSSLFWGLPYRILSWELFCSISLESSGGLLPVAQYLGFRYTILPSIGIGFYTLAMVSRLMRASMLEVVQQDYIKTAKSKGISKMKIIYKHQIRNAITPVVTVLGPIVASVLCGTFVIESIFAIPGMGKYYVESVQNLDYSLVLGMTVIFGFFLILANLIVDILYGIIDPQVRVQESR